MSSLLDPPAADIDLDAGDVADQPARREADEDILDIGAGDPLGLLDRLADRDLGALHVGDEAALDAAALALAGAEDAAGSPSSPGSAISAETFDEPMSSAVTSFAGRADAAHPASSDRRGGVVDVARAGGRAAR